MAIKKSLKNITLGMILAASSIFPGCSANPEKNIAEEIDKTYDLQMENEKRKVANEINRATYEAIQKIDEFYAEKQKGMSPQAKKIKELVIRRKSLEKKLTNTTRELRKELNQNILGYSEYSNTNSSNESARKRTTDLGIYYGKLFQDSSKTKKSLGPAEVTGLEVNFPNAYLFYESGRKNDIKKSELFGYSETDTSVSSVGGGLKFNLIESKLFEMDVNAGLRRTTEKFSSRGKINSFEFNINKKDSFNGLDLGAGFTINFNKVYASIRGNYTNWSAANKGEDLNSKGTYTVTLNFGARF